MCMQCVAGVATAGAAATGVRAWLATRGFDWLTARRLKRITACLIALAVVASSLVIG